MLYFYPLIFILPFVIIIGIPIFGILYIKDTIFNTRPKLVYDFEQAALFIHQRLSNEVIKEITEKNIVGILRIKHEFPNNMSGDDLVHSIRDRYNSKFTDGEIAEILRLEKVYMKELEFTFINTNTGSLNYPR